MSTLVAIAYPDVQTAFEVRHALGALQKQYLLDLADAVVVTRDAEGKVKLDQSVPIVEAGAANGALWGGLIGLLFLNPLAGLAVGAAAGGLMGKAADYGIDDNFMRELGSHLQPNSSALFILTRGELNDRVLPELGRYGGTVIQTSLTSEGEQRLREALSESAYRAAGGAVDFGSSTGGSSGDSAGGGADGAGSSGGTTSGGLGTGGTSGGTTTGGLSSDGLSGGTTTGGLSSDGLGGGTTTGGLTPGGLTPGGTTSGESGPRGTTPGGTTGGQIHSHGDSTGGGSSNGGAAPDGGPIPKGAPGSGDERIAPDGSDQSRPTRGPAEQGVSQEAADSATEPPIPDVGRSAK